jgi:hypothetical protein
VSHTANGLGKVLVRMLLRVPAFHVPDKATMEGHGSVAVAVGTIERPEPLAPLGGLEELVRVVEGVARFVTQVHADLANVLEIVELLLETRQIGVGQIERDPDDRLLGRAPPLVGEIRGRAEALESLGLEIPVEARRRIAPWASPRA